MRFLASGKVKDIYELDAETLLFRFSDRVSAFDVKFDQSIPKKGEALCSFAQFWFERLPVKSHFVSREDTDSIKVKKMQMIPVECVVRGYYYGSLVSRAERGQVSLPEGTDRTLAARLPAPVFDPTTKSEHDVPLEGDAAVRQGLVAADELEHLRSESIRIYDTMADLADRAGFILADLKLEFGRLDGTITLGDSIGPDEYRLWLKDDYAPGRIQEAYDKQILRDWLVSKGYDQKFEQDRSAGITPKPPEIPSDIIAKMTKRYTSSYERFSGL